VKEEKQIVQTRQSTIVRWCIETDDRIGMVRDIVTEIADLAVNLEAMQVVSRFVYVRLLIQSIVLPVLEGKLQRVPGVALLQKIPLLPFEAEEKRLIRRVMQQDTEEKLLSFADMTTESSEMKRVIRTAEAVAGSDAPVLITGESGTGKELLARAIHNASSRLSGRFIPVNCAAIPETLLESELFGYVDGAFTGAQRGGKPGLFEVAHGGTLFLDEIGEMNVLLQAKLLRVLADGDVRRIGSTSTTHINVRIIAATNQNLDDMLKTGSFRTDLFYRLNVIPLHLPPLRERREDILPIANRFLERMSLKLSRTFQWTGDAADALSAYDFRGNIRELQNIVERACYLTDDSAIDSWCLNLAHPKTSRLSSRMDGQGGSLRERVQAYEIGLIQHAIQECGSLRAAAKLLGTTHTALSNKLKAWNENTSLA
jgi:transcriptional regulator with PAS, ATPase and Fis domain